MSDDWGLSHWFRDDDDWMDNLVRGIRDLVTNPNPVSFTQLVQFSEQVARHAPAKGQATQLRNLESSARSYDLSALPAASLFAIAGIVEANPKSVGKQLAELPLAQLNAIMRPRTNRLNSGDIVGLVKLAAAQSAKQDVLEDLDANMVADHISIAGLRSLTLSELRSTIEGICTSGALAQHKGH